VSVRQECDAVGCVFYKSAFIGAWAGACLYRKFRSLAVYFNWPNLRLWIYIWVASSVSSGTEAARTYPGKY